MGSFKLRLVIYFMLLALLPLVAATVAFSEVAERGETGSADSRLSTAIRVAQADYEEQIRRTRREAERSLANATRCSRHSKTRTGAELLSSAKEVRSQLVLLGGGEFLAGQKPPPFDAVPRSARERATRKPSAGSSFSAVRRRARGRLEPFRARRRRPLRLRGQRRCDLAEPDPRQARGSASAAAVHQRRRLGYRALGTDRSPREPSLDRPVDLDGGAQPEGRRSNRRSRTSAAGSCSSPPSR